MMGISKTGSRKARAKAHKAPRSKIPLPDLHKADLGVGGDGVFIERHLRSGTKKVPLVAKKKGYRQNPNMLIPLHVERSTLQRKSMTAAHTQMIATVGARSRNLTQQVSVASATDWSSVSSAQDQPQFALKDAGLARCHILADSRVAVIVPDLIRKLAASGTGAMTELPPAVNQFVEAMLGQPKINLVNGFLLSEANKVRGGKATSSYSVAVIVNALSLGENNLFLGDANRNGDISNGFDMLFDDRGRPDPRALRIRDAVIRLAAHRLLDFNLASNAITPTRDRRTGMALSSGQGEYDPEEQLDWRMEDEPTARQYASESPL